MKLYLWLPAVAFSVSCAQNHSGGKQSDTTLVKDSVEILLSGAISKPLITARYSADPSAHVFNGRIYIYPSHHYDAGIPENDNGDHFAMKGYYI